MTTEIQAKLINCSSVYKMNSTEFWQHTRSSLNINDDQQNNLLNCIPSTETQLQNGLSPINHQTQIDINPVHNIDQLTPKPEGLVRPSSTSLPTNGSANHNNNTTTPNGQLTLGNMQLQLSHQNNNHLINQQTTNLQHPSQSSTPAENSIPDTKLNTEKLTTEFQQLSRSNNSAAAISERTLEECWSTLQRIFMHKSAMQMQHARDLQRVGGNSTVGGIVANNVSVTTSNQSGQSGGGGGGGGGVLIMTTEVKPHQCQQCLKSFSSNHQLVQHIRVHTGEKPYKCHFCERRFKQLSHVQQHTRLHTGERPYKCHLPDCGRAFIQLSNLQQHLRNHDAQVERAKNRPFHCNICGKGFATESSLRTHTSKSMREGGCDGMGELQLHLGVLQQHAALIGGPNASSCPICHKLFLGSDALMEHMKHSHKEPNTAGVAKKRRTTNHPCPVCGKHYINEGSLRKHLACHPETAQLTSNLRMWPCSVCQAVFTHEGGLLTHMEHMRMDPKHQFAAQYVLSRAAAERRERDTILAAAVAVSASGSGLLVSGSGGENSLCASPSVQSDCSSINGNGRLSSTGSDAGLIHNQIINNNNNNTSNNNNNNNPNTENNYKMNDIQRCGNNGGNNGHLLQHPQQQQQQQQYNNNCVELHLNRVSGGIVPNSNNENEGAVSIATAMRTNINRRNNNFATNGANSPQAINAVPDGISMHMTTQHHNINQSNTDSTMRMHQHAEALLRTQALRLAVTQATTNAAINNSNNNNNTNSNNSNDINNVNNQLRQQHQNGNSNSPGGCSGNTNNNSYSCTNLNNSNYNNFSLTQHQK